MSRAAAIPPIPPPTSDRVLPGVGLMLVFCTVAPLIDVASKMAVQTVPAGTVTLARFVIQALLMTPIALVMGLPTEINSRIVRLTLLRALAAIGSTFCFVAAVRLMPIAYALAIAFVSPFILLLMGRVILKEEVGPRRIAASVVAFLGTVLVIQPSFARFGTTAFLPIGSAFCFALYMLVTRHLSCVQHLVTVQIHTALAASLLCLPLLAIGSFADVEPIRFVLPHGVVWLSCLSVGIAATVSHLAMTFALALAPSSTLAPLNYLEIVTATLFGFLSLATSGGNDVDRDRRHREFGPLCHPSRAARRETAPLISGQIFLKNQLQALSTSIQWSHLAKD
ncbi:DMT family transporter [Aureimonas glaciei]|uniref:Membrane protein n=1 Tax=Aureimonas glaciei TaxID=1776957 RepID=A0A917DHS3_9HYPH|nr:DMT family transporter [Aureimonas glaciei]GGD38181.1 membrane protein [Aureimonas glaciei]